MNVLGRTPCFVAAWVGVLLIVCVAPALADAGASRVDEQLQERAATEFDLYYAEIATLETDPTPYAAQQVTVPYAGETFVLDMSPHAVRSEDFQVLYALADGTLEAVDPGPARTFRGTIQGLDGSFVAGSITEDGIVAKVRFPDGDAFWVEPMAGRVDGALFGDHVIYHESDVVPHGGSCAAEANAGPMPGSPESGGGCEGNPCVAELAIDADVEYFNAWGAQVESRVTTITNIMNDQYESEVGITHIIPTIIVRTTEPDPYTTADPEGLLSQFRSHWNTNHTDIERDVAELFTGRDLNGSTIGIAYVGTICGSSAYGVVQNLSSTGCATDLSAHEIGHMWNAPHCSCPNHTMNSGLTCSNQFNAVTIPIIVAFRNSRQCLGDAAPLTSFPFSDDFVDNELDPTRWLNEGVNVNQNGNNEPSEPYSIDVFGEGRATSGFMDASVVDQVLVEYWWQRTGTLGNNGSPENGEDLVMEYLSQGGLWEPGLQHPGGGSDNDPFEHACLLLPESAAHESLQVRFRMINAEVNDHFFVDNVRVIDGSDVLGIATQPQLQEACLGGLAEFSVVAEGDGPFTYQWFRNGVLMSGETSDTLELSPVGAGDFTNFTVEVSNACGTVTSNDAALIEVFPLTITQNPSDSEVAQGGTIALFSGTSGGGASYQWYFNDEPIDGATASFLFIADAQCDNQGCYHVVATNNCSEAVSETAIVTITDCGAVTCDSTTPPEIVHNTGLPGETRPFSGYIDPRAESSDGVNLDLGITEVAILFSENVEDVGGGGLTTAAFSVSETGGATPPNVIAVDDSAMPLVVLTLDRPITLQEYTTIQAVVQDELGNVIVDNGDQGPGVNETDRVDIGFLPGDIDQSGGVTPFDLLEFRQIASDAIDPTLGTEEDYIDTNRDSVISPFDLLNYRQLINGLSPATQTWSGATMNNPQP